MNLVYLSNDDIDEVLNLFTEFHQSYAPFFQNATKSVAKSAKDYVHGQLFTKQVQNLTQYCREVPDSDYEAMQHFISDSPWDDKQITKQLQRDVCNLLGDSNDGALILDESGIPKQGKMSVGVERQYCGRLGKVDNCQVGVYVAYANSDYTSLIDYRLYLPESWINDTERRAKCAVPDDICFKTKAQLGLEMIHSFRDSGLPFCLYGLSLRGATVASKEA